MQTAFGFHPNGSCELGPRYRSGPSGITVCGVPVIRGSLTMRIGLIAGPWVPVPPVTYGGSERVVDSLARGFAEAGPQVLLAATPDSPRPGPLVPGLRPAAPSDMGQTVSELSHVIRAYEGMWDMDVIHDHTVAGPLYSHRPPDIPVVTTIPGRLLPD